MKTKQWASSGLLMIDLFNDKLIVGKKLVPRDNESVFAMPHSVFKVKRLDEPSYEILNVSENVSEYTGENYIVRLKGKDDIYSMIGPGDLFTGMDLV